MSGQNDKAVQEVKKDVPEVVTLGEGEVFVKRDSGGLVKCVKACVALSEALGEIAKVGDKWAIQVSGFSRLNQIANINILTPPTCVVDGIAQSNPHVERHPKSKVIQTVTVRKLAFGYSPTGNIVAVDNTLFFNIFTYFIQDLQSKIKRCPACGLLGTRDNKPGKIMVPTSVWKKSSSGKSFKEAGPDKEMDYSGKQMVFYEIEDPVGVWIDITHPEIQACFDSHTQRQKFGDRHAQSICERNCLKKHPAIAANTVLTKDGFANVNVYGWKHDLDFTKLNEMSDKIAAGQVDDKTIEVQTATETADFVEAQAEVIADTDEHGQSPVDAEKIEEELKISDDIPVEPAGDKTEEEIELDKKIAEGKEIIGDEKYDKILSKLNITDIDKANIQMKKAVWSIINTAADQK